VEDLRMFLEARRAERSLPAPAERRRLRLAAGLTQPELAAFVGVGAPALCRWEGGSRTPQGEFAARYAAALATIRVELDG
jgi:transcriptional regulator with XRE-family HTH domain